MSKQQEKQIEAAHRFAEFILRGECKWQKISDDIEWMHAGGDLYVFRIYFMEKFISPFCSYGFGFGKSLDEAYDDLQFNNRSWRKQKRWHVWERRHLEDCNNWRRETEDVVLGDNVPGETLLDAVRYCSEHFGYPDMAKMQRIDDGCITFWNWNASEVYGHVVNGKEEEK